MPRSLQVRRPGAVCTKQRQHFVSHIVHVLRKQTMLCGRIVRLDATILRKVNGGLTYFACPKSSKPNCGYGDTCPRTRPQNNVRV